MRGCPKGLGSPVFDKLEAELAKALMSLPASKVIPPLPSFLPSCSYRLSSPRPPTVFPPLVPIPSFLPSSPYRLSSSPFKGQTGRVLRTPSPRPSLKGHGLEHQRGRAAAAAPVLGACTVYTQEKEIIHFIFIFHFQEDASLPTLRRNTVTCNRLQLFVLVCFSFWLRAVSFGAQRGETDRREEGHGRRGGKRAPTEGIRTPRGGKRTPRGGWGWLAGHRDRKRLLGIAHAGQRTQRRILHGWWPN